MKFIVERHIEDLCKVERCHIELHRDRLVVKWANMLGFTPGRHGFNPLLDKLFIIAQVRDSHFYVERCFIDITLNAVLSNNLSLNNITPNNLSLNNITPNNVTSNNVTLDVLP